MGCLNDRLHNHSIHHNFVVKMWPYISLHRLTAYHYAANRIKLGQVLFEILTITGVDVHCMYTIKNAVRLTFYIIVQRAIINISTSLIYVWCYANAIHEIITFNLIPGLIMTCVEVYLIDYAIARIMLLRANVALYRLQWCVFFSIYSVKIQHGIIINGSTWII
jgi:hypothetical protein